MTRALLFGAGSIGSIYVYILDKAGAEVTAVCRSNYEAVTKDGFTIQSKVFGNVSVKPRVVRSLADAAGEWDFVVVAAKAFPGTAALIKPVVGPTTAIVLIQNGIDIEKDYAELYPANTIISTVVYLPATQVQPGLITMGSMELLEIGTYPANAPEAAKAKATEFAALITAGGATAKLYDDVQEKRWTKLIVNASWNPICALVRLSDTALMRASSAAADMVYDVMLEVVAVANAAGYPGVTPELAKMLLARAQDRLVDHPVGIEPSMLADVRGRRSMEIDAILGNTVARAEALGVKVPVMKVLLVLATGLNAAMELER